MIRAPTGALLGAPQRGSVVRAVEPRLVAYDDVAPTEIPLPSSDEAVIVAALAFGIAGALASLAASVILVASGAVSGATEAPSVVAEPRAEARAAASATRDRLPTGGTRGRARAPRDAQRPEDAMPRR